MVKSKKVGPVKAKPARPAKDWIYREVPELDWLKDLCGSVANNEIWINDDEIGDKLWLVYKYLLWSKRYQQSDPKGRERLVAYGFTVKYHNLLYGITPSPADTKSVEMAKIGYAELKKEFGED